MTSSPHGPYVWGYTRATMVGTEGSQIARCTLIRLPVLNRRKVGTTSSHHGPYVWGYKRATMAMTVGSNLARGS